MKRGLITWDHEELARAHIESRIESLRARAREREMGAVVVYTDVGRSNDVRYLVNFMPYFNRALLAVPADGEPVLVCGLSPRVYPWIRSVTVLEDIRPGKRPVERLMELAKEKGWTRIGVVDLEKFPHELHRELVTAGVEVVSLEGLEKDDEAEVAMRKTALAIARPLVESVSEGEQGDDHAVVAELERKLRGAGMEDVVIRLSHGDGVPRGARGVELTDRSSVLVAAEYRGHWISLARSLEGYYRTESFAQFLDGFTTRGTDAFIHELSGPHPFQAVPTDRELSKGHIAAVTLRYPDGVLYGETCRILGPRRAELL